VSRCDERKSVFFCEFLLQLLCVIFLLIDGVWLSRNKEILNLHTDSMPASSFNGFCFSLLKPKQETDNVNKDGEWQCATCASEILH